MQNLLIHAYDSCEHIALRLHLSAHLSIYAVLLEVLHNYAIHSFIRSFSPAQSWVWHVCERVSVLARCPLPFDRRHDNPPFEAEGLLQDRVLVWLPCPHVTLHVEKAHCPQTPLTKSSKKGGGGLDGWVFIGIIWSTLVPKCRRKVLKTVSKAN